MQSRIKALEKMELVPEPEDDSIFTFEFPNPEPIDTAILQCSDIEFGWQPDEILLKDVNCNVSMTSRIGVLGANGVGKSTLLQLLLGSLEPRKGKVFRDASARVAVFAQHHMEGMDLALSPVEFMMSLFKGVKEQEFRTHLGKFGLNGDLALQRIGE